MSQPSEVQHLLQQQLVREDKPGLVQRCKTRKDLSVMSRAQDWERSSAEEIPKWGEHPLIFEIFRAEESVG